ncbi:hypothetical protein ACFSTD_11040 [Novosphingobium colocasiae]
MDRLEPLADETIETALNGLPREERDSLFASLQKNPHQPAARFRGGRVRLSGRFALSLNADQRSELCNLGATLTTLSNRPPDPCAE